MTDDEHLLNRLSTISALYNRIDSGLDTPGLELSQSLRELGFQAAQAADYVDQRIALMPTTSPATSANTVPATNPSTAPSTGPITAPTTAPTTNVSVAVAPSTRRPRKQRLVSFDAILANNVSISSRHQRRSLNSDTTPFLRIYQRKLTPFNSTSIYRQLTTNLTTTELMRVWKTKRSAVYYVDMSQGPMKSGQAVPFFFFGSQCHFFSFLFLRKIYFIP